MAFFNGQPGSVAPGSLQPGAAYGVAPTTTVTQRGGRVIVVDLPGQIHAARSVAVSVAAVGRGSALGDPEEELLALLG